MVFGCWLGLNSNGPFGTQPQVQRVQITDLTRDVLKKIVLQVQCISLIVTDHTVDLSALREFVLVLRVMLCKALLAVCVPCCAVYHPWGLD